MQVISSLRTGYAYTINYWNMCGLFSARTVHPYYLRTFLLLPPSEIASKNLLGHESLMAAWAYYNPTYFSALVRLA